MSLVCAQCSRVNPAEAAYCYFDGAALAGRATGAVDAAKRPFAQPFLFSDGTQCRNFDELALGCQAHWSEAAAFLQQGGFGAFFGGMGRADLARTAAEAARFPDPMRGLDQLLAKLPTRALQPAKLQIEPATVNVGKLKVGEDRVISLNITNLGMRLLHGTVTSECNWLTVGDAPGQAEKLFQVDGTMTLQVRVRGKDLRAGVKPLEGQLGIDSSGGETTVKVQVEVPIAPFPAGLFAGAITPRQVAEKSVAQPKDAAPYFTNGEVARWYGSNGWKYPVQGPTMPGVAGVQQFFEALGVTKPPPVTFSPAKLDFDAKPGQLIQTEIAVAALDVGKRKVVYGWATGNQPWIEIGAMELRKPSTIIPIKVKVPSDASTVLMGAVTVFGNGSQKSVVPIRVGVAAPTARPKSVVTGNPFALTDDRPEPVAPTPQPASAGSPFALAPTEGSRPRRARGLSATEKLSVFGPLLILTLLLGAIIARDIVLAPSNAVANIGIDPGPVAVVGKQKEIVIIDPGDVDPKPHILVKFDEGFKGVDYTDSMMFAVHKVGLPGRGDIKLNWYDNGLGNSTVVRVDKIDQTLGNRNHGHWTPGGAKTAGKYGGKTRTWVFKNSDIHVMQTVTVEPGEPLPAGAGKFKRPLSVCLVRYTIHNKSPHNRRVGIRTLLDTCIGENDGVPFLIPGEKERELVSTCRDFQGGEVPDFVEILERPDLSDPGIIARLNMRLAPRFEMPSRFLMTRYPVSVSATRADLGRWDVPLVPIGDDSCVVMYWEEKQLHPNETRDVGFSYGLGNLSVAFADTPGEKGSLGLSIGGSRYVNGELTVVALVADPEARTATLKLPAGLELVDKAKPLAQAVAKAVPGANGRIRPVPVTWRVRAVRAGQYDVVVATDTSLSQSQRVAINVRSLFN